MVCLCGRGLIMKIIIYSITFCWWLRTTRVSYSAAVKRVVFYIFLVMEKRSPGSTFHPFENKRASFDTRQVADATMHHQLTSTTKETSTMAIKHTQAAV